MPFKLTSKGTAAPQSPEALFRDLRNRSVEGLLSQQADMLRKYMENVEKPDLALQMLTGSGKTLVGLLICEWRRRARNERTVFLCPTRQLVNQVVEQSQAKYGIQVQGFVGSKRNFASAAASAYQNADVVAVTTYSSLFNTNPFFDDANVIVLDDAHAADNYIGEFYSLLIDRRNSAHAQLFSALLDLLKDLISPNDYRRMSQSESSEIDTVTVNMLPFPKLLERQGEISSLLDAHCAGESELKFNWQTLRNHLAGCQLYISNTQFLFRPLLPPTDDHPAFASATQRIYMSATLGEGGDLERLIGRRSIARIPAPPGWDRQGVGRRLFFFPMRSLESEDCDDLVVSMAKKAGRALVLTPSNREANVFRETLTGKWRETTLFSAADIEESKQVFTNTQDAIAVVANRYDGIDLLGDECRLLVVNGLPRSMNLQEQFLMSRLGASVLYHDRIRTRIVQAIGRCTRAAADYAAVVVLGEAINKYLLQSDTRKFLHPEIQAEIEFGIENSTGMQDSSMLENLDMFLTHGEPWHLAEDHIISERDKFTQETLPCFQEFLDAVPHEIDYQYCLWRGDPLGGLEAARKVLTCLKDPLLRGYRAFWYYQAGNAAFWAHNQGETSQAAVARDFYNRAAGAAKGLAWLHELGRMGLASHSDISDDETAMDAIIERLECKLVSLGTINDGKFERVVKTIFDGLEQQDSVPFEAAQVALGDLLGYVAANSDKTDQGAPDPWWILTATEGIVFEDYTECSEGAAIPISKVRQLAGHPKWLASRDETRGISFRPVFLSPADALAKGALPQADGLFYWKKDALIEWARSAIGVVRDLRRGFGNPGDIAWRATAKEAYIMNGLSPQAVLEVASKLPLSNLSEFGN